MTILSRVREFVTDDDIVYECRHCGATLRPEREECPHCGRGETVAYDIE